MIESQDGVGAPREIAFQKSQFYYSPVWSPDSKKLLYTDTNLNVWVMDIATGQAKIVGNDPWMVPRAHAGAVVEPRLEVGRVRIAPQHALSRDRRLQRRDRREAAAHRRPRRCDVSGVGCERQVPVVPRIDRLRPGVAVARHDVVRARGNVRAVSRRAQQDRREPAACRRATRIPASARKPAENTNKPPGGAGDRDRSISIACSSASCR